MHSRTICIIALLAFTAPALAQPTPSTTCTREPHSSTHAESPQLKAAHRAVHQACAADMATFCSGVPKGCGQPKQCLKAHAAQLSPACTTAWQNLRAMRKGHG
jgi:hypothetical protein